MNTDCLLLLNPATNSDPEGDLWRAAARVQEYEARFSRFSPSSDLTRLNEDKSEQVEVSWELGLIIGRARDYARLTGGVFDPVVLADMKAIGYDRSFEEIGGETQSGWLLRANRSRWTDISVDTERGLVSRPREALVDLGGLAKGAAADAALAELAAHSGALVDLGGDIRTAGQPDDADGWSIGMDDGDGSTLDTIRLNDGAVATSSVAKRRWVNNGAIVHHVIDPRTGLPTCSDVLQCSVIADTAEHADVAAKVGLILGASSLCEEDGLGPALGVRGVAWITRDGAYVSTSGWRAHAGRD